jgi:hypothetical protein
MFFSTAILMFSIFLEPWAMANERVRIPLISACPHSDSFKQQIYNCGQNPVAVRFAERCSQELKSRSKERGKQLAEVMKALQSQLTNNQRNTMSDSMKRLELAITAMEVQIIELQANTNQAASYTDAMIDFPDGNDDDSSAECFNQSFHGLQRIISDLDQEIIQSKKARDEAIALRAQIGGNRMVLGDDARSVNTVDPRSMVNRGDRGPNRAPSAQSGHSVHHESGVTGEENLEIRHSPGR